MNQLFDYPGIKVRNMQDSNRTKLIPAIKLNKNK